MPLVLDFHIRQIADDKAFDFCLLKLTIQYIRGCCFITRRFNVKMQLQYVEKYKHQEAFVCLLDQDKSNLVMYLAPIVYMTDTDEHAKRFDNLMYGLMIAQLEESQQFKKGKRHLMDMASTLLQRATIQQVKEKLNLIQSICTDEFWECAGLLDFETVRKELRSLIKFSKSMKVKRYMRLILSKITSSRSIVILNRTETLL